MGCWVVDLVIDLSRGYLKCNSKECHPAPYDKRRLEMVSSIA